MYSDDESYNGPTMKYEEYDGSRPFSEYKIDDTLTPSNPGTSDSVPSFTITLPTWESSASNAAMVPPRLALNDVLVDDVTVFEIDTRLVPCGTLFARTVVCKLGIPPTGQPISIELETAVEDVSAVRAEEELSQLVRHVVQERHRKNMSSFSEAMATKYHSLKAECQKLQEERSQSDSHLSESIKMSAKQLAGIYRDELNIKADVLKDDLYRAFHEGGWHSDATDPSFTVGLENEVFVKLDITPDFKQESDVE